MYRDCLNGQAPFDDPIILFIFEAISGNYQTVAVPIPSQTPQLVPEDWDNCVGTPYSICVEEAIYQTTLILPPIPGGYDLAWARCCRNQAITNLSVPLQEGVTFLAHIPDPTFADCNSMPIFNNTPPIFLCANQTFAFDYSATDPDGDSLVYSICNPYNGFNFQGLGAGNPNFGSTSPIVDLANPMGPPPYQNVVFAGGFSATDPFGSGDLTIDPQTGFLTVTPNVPGIFVMAVCVQEFRDGVLLSENKRDFQIHVIQCLPPETPPTISHDFGTLPSNGDTIFIEAGQPFCYDVTAVDIDPNDTLAGYAVSATFDNAFAAPPAVFTYTGTNPISGQVCWTPGCNYDGQVLPLIVAAFDVNACANNNHVFDTSYVVISSPPNIGPDIVPDYAGLNVSNDTIIISAGAPFCYTFQVDDPNQFDSLAAYPNSPIFNDPNGPTIIVTGTNPLSGQVCWTPGCNLEGQTVELSLGAQDFGECHGSLNDFTTVYVRVEVAQNEIPVIQQDISNLVTSNDTVFIEAGEVLCYDFTATDLDAFDSLSISSPSAIFTGPGAATITYSGSNPVNGQICWEAACQYEGQTFEVILETQDPGHCSNLGIDTDTIYITVLVPDNTPPDIDHNFGALNFSNDTIYTLANDAFCYTFQATDINVDDTLEIISLSPIFSVPDPPVLTFFGENPVNGQICWQPGCDYVDQTIEIILETRDDAKCSAQGNAFDTVYITIQIPPNDPPVAQHDLSSQIFVDDTIFVDPLDTLCYFVTLTDANTADTLFPFTVSPIFTGNPPATFITSGTNPVVGQVCWPVNCDYQGQLLEIVVGASDNGECEQLTVYDTVFVQVSSPVNIPPLVGHDLTGTNHNGDTIFISVGDGFCYDFYVADLTTEQGVTYTYEFQDYTGFNLGLGNVQATFENDSINGEVCFQSLCSNGGSFYRIIITGIDNALCPPFAATKDTVYLVVNTDFDSDVGADLSFCEGTGGVTVGAIPLGGQGPYTYFWDCSNPGGCGISDPNSATPTVNPASSPTTYFVQVTDALGCTSEKDCVVVAIDALPVVDAGRDTIICEGAAGVFLQGSVVNSLLAPGPYSLEWTPATGLTNPYVMNPYALPDTTTIYTLIVTSANGCTSVPTTLDTLSTVTVTVNPRPVIEAGPDRSGCKGDSIPMLGAASGAGPDYTFQWTPATGLADPTDPNTMASPPFHTVYFLQAYSNGCPGVVDSVTFFVRTVPTADPGPVLDICATDSVMLDGIAGGDSTATYTYEWQPPLGLADPLSPMTQASPDTTTLYELIATTSFGCRGVLYEATVLVLPTPIADAGTDIIMCRGEGVNLQGSHSFYGGINPPSPSFYSWAPTVHMTQPFIPDPYITPDSSIIYQLTVSNGACSTTDLVTVDVFEPIDAVISVDTNVICSGNPLQLTVAGGFGSAQYQWYPANTLSDSTISNPIASPDTTITYYVEVQENNCSDMDSVQISVFPSPDATYFNSTPWGCTDLTVNFFAMDSNIFLYEWNFGDGSPTSNEANPVHVYSNAGSYPVSLTVTGAGGCSDSESVTVIQAFDGGNAQFGSTPLPADPPLILPNATVTFDNQSINGTSYIWTFGDGTGSTDMHPTHTYQAPGEYTVELTVVDSAGCTSVYTQGVYVVSSPSLFIPNVFSPNGDGLYDTFEVLYSGVETYQMQVFNRWGVLQFEGTTPTLHWDGFAPGGTASPEGVYYYVLKIGDKSYTGDLTLLR